MAGDRHERSEARAAGAGEVEVASGEIALVAEVQGRFLAEPALVVELDLLVAAADAVADPLDEVRSGGEIGDRLDVAAEADPLDLDIGGEFMVLPGQGPAP